MKSSLAAELESRTHVAHKVLLMQPTAERTASEGGLHKLGVRQGVRAMTAYRLLLLAVLVCITAPAAAERVAPRSGLVEDSYFGMHMHYLVKPNSFGRTTKWPAIKFGSWRLLDAYVKWKDLEPKRGQWDFSVLDRYVSLAEAHGVNLLYTLGHPPQWASARPYEPSYAYGPGSAAEPADVAQWENYIRTIAKRYRGRIRAYEVWNEPWFQEIDKPFNKDGKAAFYSGTAAKMVELAHIAYRAIKEEDPGALVLTPAFDHAESGVKRLDLYLSLGGVSVSDAVAFHLYTSSPESMLPIIARIQAVMSKHGMGDRELWNTETGYVTENPDEPRTSGGKPPLSESEAGAYVARSLVLAAAAGVRRFYWYAWDNFRLGLTFGRGRVPNLAAQAYEQTGRWLRGATIEACESEDRRQWICTIKRGTRVAWIAWRTDGEGEWRPPAPVAEFETLGGSRFPVADTRAIRVDRNPILVKSDRSPWAI